MPKVRYSDKRLSEGKLQLIQLADQVCREYEQQGFILTLRQLYYQFVSRDWIPNTQRDYKRLGDAVNDGRLAGLIDWNHITDRTRNLQALQSWGDPSEIVNDSAGWYHRDLWARQSNRVEVWIEKDALVGVIEGVCERNDVAYFSCRGYTSQSEVWRAAMRHRRHERAGQEVILLHLGDHDPSGIDMTRDIRDRLRVFGASTQVERIALTMEQIEEHQPPPNPAKATDARFRDYQALYGDESWELDALDPATMVALIEQQVSAWRDDALWRDAVHEQEGERERLQEISDRWGEIEDFLADS